MKNIKWNEITWYSKLGAVILFVGVIPVLFYIGREFEKVVATPLPAQGIQASEEQGLQRDGATDPRLSDSAFTFFLLSKHQTMFPHPKKELELLVNDKERGGENHFCVIGQQFSDSETAWVYWKEDQSILLWEPVYPESVAKLSLSKRYLHLSEVESATQLEAETGTHMVTLNWWHALVDDCQKYGEMMVVSSSTEFSSNLQKQATLGIESSIPKNILELANAYVIKRVGQDYFAANIVLKSERVSIANSPYYFLTYRDNKMSALLDENNKDVTYFVAMKQDGSLDDDMNWLNIPPDCVSDTNTCQTHITKEQAIEKAATIGKISTSSISIVAGGLGQYSCKPTTPTSKDQWFWFFHYKLGRGYVEIVAVGMNSGEVYDCNQIGDT